MLCVMECLDDSELCREEEKSEVPGRYSAMQEISPPLFLQKRESATHEDVSHSAISTVQFSCSLRSISCLPLILLSNFWAY